MAELPLSGIRVLDFTQVYAGPTCTRILADLGADVIKVEGVKRVDITRNFVIADNQTQDDYWNRSGYFDFRNGGKRSLTLDPNEEQSTPILRKLVEQSDIVAESFTPRVMAKFGLGYESLKEIKPDIIMISLSGYGQTGPWRDWTGYGMGLEPASGISSLTGYRGGDPLRTGISFTDPYSGIVGAGSVLAALAYRRRTGKGQHIDLSEQEAAIPITAYAVLDYAMNGREAQREGNRSRWYAPQGAYPCQGDDNWIAITVRDDEEWAALCKATEHPEWAADERFGDVLGRFDNHDALDELIGSWTREQDHIAAMHHLQQAGVIAAAVLNPKEVLFDQHLGERGHYRTVDTGHGRRPVPRQLGARFSAFETDSDRRAPKLGEHNREILQGLAGLSDEEVMRLEEAGIAGETPVTEIPLDVYRMVFQVPNTSLQQMNALSGLEDDYKQQLGIDGEDGQESRR